MLGEKPPEPICRPCANMPEYHKSRFKLMFTGLNYCIYKPHDRNVAIVHVFSFTYPRPPHSDCVAEKLKASDVKPGPPQDWEKWEKADHDALIKQLTAMNKRGLKAIVFDLRRTGGGRFNPSLGSHFTDQTYGYATKSFHYAPAFSNPEDDWEVLQREDVTLFMRGYPQAPSTGIPNAVGQLRKEKRKTKGLERSKSLPFYCRKDCSPEEANYPGKPKPLGPVGVILGPPCSSACDVFASMLVDNGIAKASVGLPTAGASAPYRATIPLRLADDTEMRLEVTVGVDYRPGKKKDTILDGHPVVPAKLLLPRSTDPVTYFDRALEQIYSELGLD